MIRLRFAAFGILVAAVLLPGCKKDPPPIVAVSGIVTLNGKPLDKAELRFYPQFPELTGEYVAMAVTDESGAFTLMTNGQSGAATCEHKVMITEGPYPKEARGESERAQLAAAAHERTLKNRPIPDRYKYLDTSVTVTVTGPQNDLKIELTN